MPLLVKHSVIKNIDELVKYKVLRNGGRRHFHLGLWIDGSEEELSKIQYVEYKLHSSFKNPIRKSQNRRNKFSVTFWTWGTFNVEVTCYMMDGTKQLLNHNLLYQLPSDPQQYVQV